MDISPEQGRPMGGIVWAGEPESEFQSCTFPGICVLPGGGYSGYGGEYSGYGGGYSGYGGEYSGYGGAWICTFRAAPRKRENSGQRVLLCRSDDEGRTWSQPEEPFPAVRLGNKPGMIRAAYLTALRDGRLLAVICWVDGSRPELPYFNEETEGLLDTEILICESVDEGRTWSEPRPVGGHPYAEVPTPITGPILEYPDGTLGLQFEVNKPYFDSSQWRHSSVMIYSTDGGANWPFCDVITNDPENRLFYWDQRPGMMKDGSVLDLFWTYDNGAARYLNIHARRSGTGQERHYWGALTDTGIAGQPAQPVDLGGGLLAMVHVDRSAVPEIRLVPGEDGARSWSGDPLILYRHERNIRQEESKGSMNDAWSEMGKFSLGLPATARCSDGSLLTVFYAGTSTDHTAIHWARVSREAVAARLPAQG